MVYWQRLLENRLAFWPSLTSKMGTCEKDDLSVECTGKSARYLFIGTEEVHGEERMMPLGHRSLSPVNMDVLYKTMCEVMGLLYRCGSTRAEVCQSRGRKWGCFLVIVSCRYESPEGKDLLRRWNSVVRTLYWLPEDDGGASEHAV